MTPTEQAADQLRQGQISFDRFARMTADYWKAQAVKQLARWAHPTDVAPEDLVQVMLMEAWIRSTTFDPAKGGTAPAAYGRYLVWNAIDKAKKYLHRVRGAAGARYNAPSRYARPFSSFVVDGEDDSFLPQRIERAVSFDPTVQVERCMDVDVLTDQAIQRAPDDATACALAALKLSGYDPDQAAERLHRDRYCRVVHELPTRLSAERLIERVIAAL